MHPQPTSQPTQQPLETELFTVTGFSLIGFLLFIIVLM